MVKSDRESYEKPEVIRHGSLKEITLFSPKAVFVGEESHPQRDGS